MDVVQFYIECTDTLILYNRKLKRKIVDSPNFLLTGNRKRQIATIDKLAADLAEKNQPDFIKVVYVVCVYYRECPILIDYFLNRLASNAIQYFNVEIIKFLLVVTKFSSMFSWQFKITPEQSFFDIDIYNCFAFHQVPVDIRNVDGNISNSVVSSICQYTIDPFRKFKAIMDSFLHSINSYGNSYGRNMGYFERLQFYVDMKNSFEVMLNDRPGPQIESPEISNAPWVKNRRPLFDVEDSNDIEKLVQISSKISRQYLKGKMAKIELPTIQQLKSCKKRSSKLSDLCRIAPTTRSQEKIQQDIVELSLERLGFEINKTASQSNPYQTNIVGSTNPDIVSSCVLSIMRQGFDVSPILSLLNMLDSNPSMVCYETYIKFSKELFRVNPEQTEIDQLTAFFLFNFFLVGGFTALEMSIRFCYFTPSTQKNVVSSEKRVEKLLWAKAILFKNPSESYKMISEAIN